MILKSEGYRKKPAAETRKSQAGFTLKNQHKRQEKQEGHMLHPMTDRTVKSLGSMFMMVQGRHKKCQHQEQRGRGKKETPSPDFNQPILECLKQ